MHEQTEVWLTFDPKTFNLYRKSFREEHEWVEATVQNNPTLGEATADVKLRQMEAQRIIWKLDGGKHILFIKILWGEWDGRFEKFQR